MPTPTPQPSAPEPPGKPAQLPVDSPPPGPDAAPPKPAREDAIFRALLEGGCDPVVAYTAEKRIHTMTSEIVAAGLQPVVAELRQMRESMVGKEDLAGFATKADLAGFPTKADLANTEANLRREMAEREVRLVKWMFGALMAQAALIVALVVGFMSLLL